MSQLEVLVVMLSSTSWFTNFWQTGGFLSPTYFLDLVLCGFFITAAEEGLISGSHQKTHDYLHAE